MAMESKNTRQRLGRGRLPRRGFLGGVVGAAGLGLVACAGSPAPAGSAGTAAPAAPTEAVAAPPAPAQPKYGGAIKTISIAGGGSQHLDPHVLNGPGLGVDVSICLSKLLDYKWGPDVKPSSYAAGPDLAESWTQPDDVTYVFKLRPGVKWHNIAPVNGRELTADDVIYSFQRIRDLKVLAGPLAGIARMEAPDKSTFKLTLDKPNADMLDNLSYRTVLVVAREVVDAKGDLKTGPMIGTGAWILDDFVAGESFRGKRNPDYLLKGRPYADSFESLRAGDPAAILNAFRANSVNVIGQSLASQAGEELLKALPNTRGPWILLDRSPNHLVVNPTVAPFNDARVRQAIHKALDRKAILDAVQLGRGVLTAGLPLPGPDWSLPEAELAKLMARDPDGARQLLREAGKESGFDFEMIVPPYISGTLITIAELVQAQLREVGVRATLKTLDGPSWGQLNANGQFQASMVTSAFPAANGTLYGYYYTGGPQNKIGYANPALDRLIDQQAVLSRDPDARKKVLLDVQRAIIADAIWMCLHAYQQPTFAAPEVRDFYPPQGISNTGAFWTSVWFDK
jgi:ABC-type transport system substrate-binding protein